MERPRCAHCRNPIKPHHVAVADGDRSFHEDCWEEARPALVVAQVQRHVDQQAEYQQSIAQGGLAALLSPYVSTLPSQRDSEAVQAAGAARSVPAQPVSP